MDLDDAWATCRGCLRAINIGAVRYNIFGSWIPPGSDVDSIIGDDLSKLAHITIKDTDEFTKSLCRACYNSLRDAYQFISTVKKSHDTLVNNQNGVNKSLTWPKPIKLDVNVNQFRNYPEMKIKQELLTDDEYTDDGFKPELAMEIKIEPEEFLEPQPQPLKTIQVTVNGTISLDEMNAPDANGIEVYENEEYLEEAIKDEPMEEDQTLLDLPLDCLLCTKSFNCHSGLKAHVIAYHSYKSVKRKNDKRSPIKKRKNKYTCATCLRSFVTSTDLMVHETCHNKAVCYSCSASFDSFQQLIKHRRRCKAAKKDVEKPKTLQDVVRHMPSGIRIKCLPKKDSVKCQSCNEEFTEEHYLRIHDEIHHAKDVANDSEEPVLEYIFGIKKNNVKNGIEDVSKVSVKENGGKSRLHEESGSDSKSVEDFCVPSAKVKVENKESKSGLESNVIAICITNTDVQDKSCKDRETLELENMLEDKSKV